MIKYYKVRMEDFDTLMRMLERFSMEDLKRCGISKTNGFLVYTLYEKWESKKLEIEEME